jgi:hypothetical protein
MSNLQNDEIDEMYRERLGEYETMRDEVEYKFLTTILRQLEDGVEQTERLALPEDYPTFFHSIKTVITAIKDRKDYLFNRGMI